MTDETETNPPNWFEPHVAPAGVPVLRLIGIMAIVAAVLVPCAMLYILLVWYIPFVKLRAIICFLYGGLAGILWGVSFDYLKSRDRLAMWGSCTAIALWTYYIQWVVWFFWLSNFQLLLLSPSSLIHSIIAVNGVGTWSMGSQPSTGTELWVIWGLEAASIMSMTVLGGLGALNKAPLCARCREFCNTNKSLIFKLIPDSKEFLEQLRANDPRFMDSLIPEAADSVHFLRLKFHRCTCQDRAVLQVDEIKMVQQEKNGPVEQPKKLVPYVYVEPWLCESLESLFTPVPPPATATDPAPESPPPQPLAPDDLTPGLPPSQDQP